jgi:hypothetical protein
MRAALIGIGAAVATLATAIIVAALVTPDPGFVPKDPTARRGQTSPPRAVR